MTRTVHCKRESFDVYIGRPSKRGNPFRLGRESDRAEVLARYEQWISAQPELLSQVHELRGKTLGCRCAPKLCHGDILARLADGREGEDVRPA
jgi:hypothetical protein